MGYSFAGFFVAPIVDVRKDVLALCPKAVFRRFREFPAAPFRPVAHLPPSGILGVTVPTSDTIGPGPGVDETVREDSAYRLFLAHLPAISSRHPHGVFAALSALCHGGPVEASGAVFRDGACVWERSVESDGYDDLIRECMAHIGADLPSGYFPPLETGAFTLLGDPLTFRQ